MGTNLATDQEFSNDSIDGPISLYDGTHKQLSWTAALRQLTILEASTYSLRVTSTTLLAF